MNVKIRKIRDKEIYRLNDFLYEAIFIPNGQAKPDREIIEQPELQLYVKGFGGQVGDDCLIAEVDGQLVGAVWVRIINDYGHVDDQTPSLAISLFKDYRGHGLGTSLMTKMLEVLKAKGVKKVSLSVQKANPALKLYRRLGFNPLSENNEDYVMVKDL
ncbi:GNAT family N-acetyltransferase [Streptococcus sobrinus]|uniref:GNAT family N-acetyltransferase n=1 Tax=Streptococcus sobrinus TaxID=1310 RepID=UPI000D706CE8|nr:GNAT family N-acetyltransferase [Streptococcus sobrinus]AWN61620.1 GNAT family N-acetyltransferase [Streptococcus sobrinus]AWN63492.1 GNAT family N-acetyltransferase [Streptococcus sobrinus]SQG19994.1 putative acetyltransferase [Streptococcus sobrinus]